MDNELDAKGEEAAVVASFVRLNNLFNNFNSFIELLLSKSKIVVFN